MKVVLSPAPAQTPDPLPVDEPPPAAAEPAAPLSVDQPPPAAREPPILGLPEALGADAAQRTRNSDADGGHVSDEAEDAPAGDGILHGYGGANKDEAPSKSPPSRLDVDDHPKNSLLPQEPDQGSSSEYPKDRSDSSSSRSCSNGSHGR
ncbi:hypothetical protein ZWY2020_030158 [Hordeum vulgare]|nr:hypothetical protein ZWY2020_030158 [Hordeum vulgare]